MEISGSGISGGFIFIVFILPLFEILSSAILYHV